MRGRDEGVHLFKHPQLGGITFEHTTYVVEGATWLRVVIFVPHDMESARKIAEQAREISVRPEPAQTLPEAAGAER